ncbi:MAG: aminoacyl-histidine dipeptidase [Lentisphaerae bacterium]|nr:aminoacyl-histidine dipeptidase [Lentisphaerota bacterium]
MNFFEHRPTKDALYYFGLICSIPHPSGHEQKLAEKIVSLANEHGLPARMDNAGNVRIDRPAAPEYENAPRIILQGHIDMVPKAAAGKTFDFETQPLELIEENGILRANGTTLGADDGAGAACILSLLFDPEVKAGALAGLFTVQEETGLIGANNLDPDMLAGDWLFNLDAGTFHEFCIGCAGGARLSFEIPLNRTEAPAGTCYTVRLRGLKGGHSGTTIHEKRGNALILLAQFLKMLNVDALCSFNGGSADNAIPAEADAVIVTEKTPEELQNAAEQFRKESAVTFNAPEEYHFEIVPAESSEKILDPVFTETFLRLAATVPNEVFDSDEELGIVKTSSNFASVHTSENLMVIHTSQRSLEDKERLEITARIKAHFAPLNGTATVTGEYPGWPANAETEPMKAVSEIHKQVYGDLPGVYAIHAGLEAGAFTKKNPSLQIISFGPPEEDIHTEREWLDLAKFEEFNNFFRIIIERTAQQ